MTDTMAKARLARERCERFPEGVMTIREWTLKHAECVERHVAKSHYHLIDRRTFNRLEGAAQAAYEARLKVRAAQPVYRAWRGESFYEIPRTIFEAAIAHGVPERGPQS